MNSFEQIISYFNSDIKETLLKLDSLVVERITEIRVRKNMPICLVIKNSTYFIDWNGDIFDYPCHNAVVIKKIEFDKLFLKLCDYSIYSSMDDMNNGFITLNNGARVGISGTYVSESNKVKDITSLNIRIPREVKNSATKLLNCLYVNSFPSIIVSGMPNSGKTTLLRDLSYQLSNGFNHNYRKTVVIDERNEIYPKNFDNFSINTGANCDVLSGFKKSKGIEIAIRTLSPEMIICDEISTTDEVNAISFGFSTGVAFALSVHLSSKEELYSKPIIKALLNSNQFSYIVMLDKYSYNIEIIDTKEVKNEINRLNNTYNFDDYDWHYSNSKQQEKNKYLL